MAQYGSMMYTDIPTLSNKVSGIEKSLDSLPELVKNQEKQIVQCQKNERDMAAMLFKLQKYYNDLSMYTQCLEDYCLDLDVNLRKKHLIMTGIKETPAKSNSYRA